MSDQHPNSEIPAHHPAFKHALSHFSDRFNSAGPVKIVAIGSSSTAGEGGIAPYPCRLEGALRDPNNWPSKGADQFKNRMIDVINRGKGGDEAPSEKARLQVDVINEKPSLVVWQVGTNAVWKACDLDPVAKAIDTGLKLLLSSRPQMDVVLMDLQYAPAILSDNRIEAAERMVKLIADAAAANPPVNLFLRFDLMRRWHEVEKSSFDRMIDPSDSDRLHQSDWSAQRIGQALCEVIVNAATRASAMLSQRRKQLRVPNKPSNHRAVSYSRK
jgi:lysophospholipase L1-like esterase